MTRVRRRTERGEEYGADFLELFFDLVFVFAITQVSHLLLADLSWEGAGQSAVVLLAVWWAWQYTTWVTNELDLEATVVRLLVLALMLGGLMMAIAIPHAWDDDALLFAGAYVAIQVGRHGFLAFAAAAAGSLERQRAAHILTWMALAGAFWIAGALADGTARTVLWLIALAVDYGAPLVLYRLPGRPRLSGLTWHVGASHMAERFGLIVIIALGESIILTGATTAEHELTTTSVAALASAFVTTAALWWLYFSAIARHLRRALEQARDSVLLTRDVYTYGHVLIVAGIILAAVGNELVIAHPKDELPDAELIVVVAGPVLYLLAQAALRLRVTGTLSVRRISGIAACLAIGLLGGLLPALAIGALLAAVLVAVAIADGVAGARRRLDAPTA